MILPVFGSRQPIKSICSEENHTLPSLEIPSAYGVGSAPGKGYSLNVSVFGSKRPILPAPNSANQIFRPGRPECGAADPPSGLVACDLVCFRIYLEQLTRRCETVKPHVIILIDFNTVRVRRGLRIIGELFRFRIEAAKWSATGPHNAFRIDAKCMLRSAFPLILKPGSERILVLVDFVCRGVPFPKAVGSLFRKPCGSVRRCNSGMDKGWLDANALYS